MIPRSGVSKCTLLQPDLCDYYNRDTFTLVTIIFTVAQLSWVTMLLFVQLVQISRAQTTLENMRGHPQLSGAGDLATAAMVTGSTSLEDAQVTRDGMGPVAHHASETSRRRGSFFEEWKRLLGIDTFIATAMYGSKAEEMQARSRQNPFTRGCITNFNDFFCDPAPVFGRRNNGDAMLGGERVDYTQLYEPPPRSSMRAAPSGDRGADYRSVNREEEV